MANSFFRFRNFTIHQKLSAMKVTTDACLFGAWAASMLGGRNGQMLDIGAGTGLLSLMLAQQFEGNITALEIDEQASREAGANFEASPWSNRLKIKNQRLQEFSSENVFDVIVSNPPFFSDDLKSPDLKRNVALHGELLTLDELFQYATPLLALPGIFALLVSARRQHEVELLAQSSGLAIARIAWVRQTQRHQPFRIMYWLNNTTVPLLFEETICIREEDGKYSPRFVELLSDYYLHLEKPPA